MAVDAKLKLDFHSKGWVISRKIGEGGGGEVHLAYRRAFVDALHSGVMAA